CVGASWKDHEAQRLSLQAEINTLTAQLADLARKHEKTCTEVRVITELSKQVFRLKEALGALTPPLPRSPSPPSSGIPGQQFALQNRVTALTQQLQDCERKHKAVVSIYRSHLLAAVQGRMDEEVQALLLQILRMTQKGQN
uniref:Uncharacterized protein n=1 Tax=Cyprinus carpio carpio TaxID=630221 RepID=A0A8C1ALC6_CYPCA